MSNEGERMMETPEILIPALRQYQHNDCSGLIGGFDYDETVKIVSVLSKSKWISVDDELPTKNTEHVVYLGRKTPPEVTVDEFELDIGAFGWHDNEVTHWQPLPEPPE